MKTTPKLGFPIKAGHVVQVRDMGAARGQGTVVKTRGVLYVTWTWAGETHTAAFAADTGHAKAILAARYTIHPLHTHYAAVVHLAVVDVEVEEEVLLTEPGIAFSTLAARFCALAGTRLQAHDAQVVYVKSGLPRVLPEV